MKKHGHNVYEFASTKETLQYHVFTYNSGRAENFCCAWRLLFYSLIADQSQVLIQTLNDLRIRLRLLLNILMLGAEKVWKKVSKS